MSTTENENLGFKEIIQKMDHYWEAIKKVFFSNNRKAMVIGFQHYSELDSFGSISYSAKAIKSQLTYNRSRTPNFDVTLLTDGPNYRTNLPYKNLEELKAKIQAFWDSGKEGDLALFYYVGHGEEGVLIMPNPEGKPDYRIPMSELVAQAEQSKFRDVIFVIDCCKSGTFGNDDMKLHPLKPGISILTSTSPTLLARAYDNRKHHYTLFSGLFKEALCGGAADMTGIITLQSIYNYVCLSLGSEHSPVLRCNATHFIPIKYKQAEFSREDMRLIKQCFHINDTKMWPKGSNWLNAYTQSFNMKPKTRERFEAAVPSLLERGFIKSMNGFGNDKKMHKFYILTSKGKRLWDMEKNKAYEKVSIPD